MKSLFRLEMHHKCILCMAAMLLLITPLFSQNPLERLVTNNGPALVDLDVEAVRVVTTDYDEFIREYVEFTYDEAVSRLILDEVPRTIRVTVPTPKGDYSLRLVEKKITSPDYRVEASAGSVVYTEPLGKHYFGIIEGEERSIASASFFNGEMTILASVPELGNLSVNRSENGRYVSYFDNDVLEFPDFTCHTEEPEEVPYFLQHQRERDFLLSQRGADPCVRFHIEADYNLFQNKGSIANTVVFVEGFMAQVKMIYDLESVNLLLSYLNVWDTVDPFVYTGDFGQGREKFRMWFQTGQGTMNGDYAQLVAFDGAGGGISNGIGQDACFDDYVKVQYTSINPSYLNFPNYSWTVNAVAHELGHCIASPHTHGCYWNDNFTQIDDCGNVAGYVEGEACYMIFNPILPEEGGTTMSYCHFNAGIDLALGFGPQPGDLLRASLAATTCLSPCPVGSCVPPGSLRIENVTSSEATISWYHATETSFEVSYGYTGQVNTVQVDDATFVTLTGLEQGKNYEFSIKTLCDGSESQPVGDDFKTVCTTVYDLPFIELFEDAEEWVVERYELAGCWTNSISDDFYGWAVERNGTPSADTGPAGDHTTGIGRFVYAEASLGAEGDITRLTSPRIDLGSVVGPFARFYYHMFGATVSGLQVQVTDVDLPVQIWNTVATINGQQQTSDADPWSEVFIDLSDYEGSTIRIRFVSTRGADFQGDIAIDDLIVTDSSLVDVSVTGIVAPVTSCGLGDSESVIATLENTGYQVLPSGTEIVLDLFLDGSPVTSEMVTLSADLAPGEFVPVEFAQTLDLSAFQVYVVSVETSLAGDGIEENNTRGLTVINRQTILTYPYTESFEDGGGWNSGTTVEDGPNTWALGTPAKNIITGASDGVNAWVTGGLGPGFYSDDESSFVESPCFDFSNLLDPVVTMDVWWDIEDGWEGARVQYSTDLGATWTTLGMAQADWYNYEGIFNGEGDDAWSGSPNHEGDPGNNLPDADGSGGWVEVTHPLTGLGESPSVLLRMYLLTDPAVTAEGIAFDNVRVTGTPIVPACYEVNLQAFTCDPGSAGEDVVILQDINGCDSIVTTVTTLLPSYDVVIQDYSCDPADTGSIVTVFAAQNSCDSVVTMRTDLWPSYDYTIVAETCDSNEVGTVVVDGFTVNGCDSTVTITTVLQEPYELLIEASSCNPADTGTVVESFTAEDGCDSIVTTTTVFVAIDAGFTYVESEGVVTFTNTSDNATGYAWTFGDGNTNDEQNPTNTYTTSGDYTITLVASAPGCESDTETVVITISIISGIDLISFIESVNVYPNPNDGNFAVELKGEAVLENLQFTLFTVAGKALDTRNVPFSNIARETYNMNDLPGGIYFLRIRSNDEQTTLKVNILR